MARFRRLMPVSSFWETQVQMIGHGPHDAAPGIEAFRWLALQTKVLGSVELRFDRRDNAEP